MERFTGVIGIVLILGLAFLLSNNRKAINYRTVISGLLTQIVLALFILKTEIGASVFAWVGHNIERLLHLADQGGEFVFGGLMKPELLKPIFGDQYSFLFMFKIMPAIIFVAVLVNIAYHIGLMQIIVSFFARIVHALMRVSGSESLSNVASAFVGQVEAQIMIKPYLSSMTMSELLASMSGSMACIAGGVMAVYISMGIPAPYLLAASIMAAPGALVIAKIVWPETEESATKGSVKLEVKKSHANLLDAISHGAGDGLKVSLNVIAMLIGFIALIALANLLLGKMGSGLYAIGLTDVFGFDLRNISLNTIFGGVFSIFAWAMGIPSQDILTAGGLMGTKMVINEFVAYSQLSPMIAGQTLHPKTIVIISFALCGFANFSSIAIQVGGIGELAPERRSDLARLGFRALICGTLASYLSATIAGIMM
ncbi:MAG: NupC/NupG family nucleoside CNT transporter [Bacteroidia bacterium]|nr:NupC/NupG family nucleoside CNT transporter [Bacteroidia bacterium]MBP7261834.1 NupC/NupG family nucleoside CNT transporter [Bacteroidia bacterium]MBP9181247.1 NupC/NupG family nucleoside CNT transporter [Bacteroidia bacterium]MBP9725040.1 NupC/NupG family nucleoside CNT transporter [Bacteroidia bacterium]